MWEVYKSLSFNAYILHIEISQDWTIFFYLIIHCVKITKSNYESERRIEESRVAQYCRCRRTADL